jgi:hypothetical protein
LSKSSSFKPREVMAGVPADSSSGSVVSVAGRHPTHCQDVH